MPNFQAGAVALTAAAGAGAVMLGCGSGTTTTQTAENLMAIAISGLTAKDTLVFYVVLEAIGQDLAGTQVVPYNNTDAVEMIGSFNDANNIVAGTLVTTEGYVKQAASANTKVILKRTQSATSSATTSTFTTPWTGAWTFALRQKGVTAGGSLAWSWALYKISGQ